MKRVGNCLADDCVTKIHARGMCSMHYNRWKVNGHIREPELINKGKECEIHECTNLAYARGICQKHMNRIRRHNDPHHVERVHYKDTDTCLLESCPKKPVMNRLCSAHSRNFFYHKKCGRVFDLDGYVEWRKEQDEKDVNE